MNARKESYSLQQVILQLNIYDAYRLPTPGAPQLFLDVALSSVDFALMWLETVAKRKSLPRSRDALGKAHVGRSVQAT